MLEPRLQCRLGAIDAVSAVLMKMPMGASHGIGHQLGPLGVGHGETSCILLPAVCKWKKKVNCNQQKQVLHILWSEVSVRKVLEGRNLEQDKAKLGDALDAVFGELGKPRSLKGVGAGRQKLEGLAVESLEDKVLQDQPDRFGEERTSNGDSRSGRR